MLLFFRIIPANYNPFRQIKSLVAPWDGTVPSEF